MPLPNQYLRLNILFDYPAESSFAGIALYYRLANGPAPSAGEMIGIADDFQTHFGGGAQGILPVQCRMARVSAMWKSGAVQVEGVSGNNPVVGGVSGSDILPEEDAVLLRRRTGLAGRSKRGRVFLPYVPETFQASGTLTQAARTAYSTFGGLMMSTLSTGTGQDFEPCTVDFKNGALLPLVAVEYVSTTVSRRDRRHPKRLFSYPAI